MAAIRIDHLAFLTPGNYRDDAPFEGIEQSLDLFAVLFGFALMALGERGQKLREIIDEAAHTVFGVIAIVVKVAPIGAFGAIAFTVIESGRTSQLPAAALARAFLAGVRS